MYIRIGSALDIPAILEVMQDAFDPRFGEAWSGPQLLGSMSMSGTWAQLAYADDIETVAGFSLTRLVLSQAELLLVAVRRDCRGIGVGHALINDALAMAHSQGADEMFLEVRDGNANALGLYRSSGFSIVGHRRGYYSGAMTERFDAITMQRII